MRGTNNGYCRLCCRSIHGASTTAIFCTPCRIWTTRVREAAYDKLRKLVRIGQVPPATTLKCKDCSEPAAVYDHVSYEPPVIEPVCTGCNLMRGPGIYPQPHLPQLGKRLELNEGRAT